VKTGGGTQKEGGLKFKEKAIREKRENGTYRSRRPLGAGKGNENLGLYDRNNQKERPLKPKKGTGNCKGRKKNWRKARGRAPVYGRSTGGGKGDGDDGPWGSHLEDHQPSDTKEKDSRGGEEKKSVNRDEKNHALKPKEGGNGERNKVIAIPARVGAAMSNQSLLTQSGVKEKIGIGGTSVFSAGK